MKLFEVELSEKIVVMAEDESGAYQAAVEDMQEIKTDTEFNIDVIGEIDAKTLPDGWNGECIPYGVMGIFGLKIFKAPPNTLLFYMGNKIYG